MGARNWRAARRASLGQKGDRERLAPLHKIVFVYLVQLQKFPLGTSGTCPTNPEGGWGLEQELER